jgi:hypothetical protein
MIEKKIYDLTKSELIHLIYNNFNISIDASFDCVTCGGIEADWYYICDECEQGLKDD